MLHQEHLALDSKKISRIQLDIKKRVLCPLFFVSHFDVKIVFMKNILKPAITICALLIISACGGGGGGGPAFSITANSQSFLLMRMKST
jgi:hypothetical protein